MSRDPLDKRALHRLRRERRRPGYITDPQVRYRTAVRRHYIAAFTTCALVLAACAVAWMLLP